MITPGWCPFCGGDAERMIICDYCRHQRPDADQRAESVETPKRGINNPVLIETPLQYTAEQTEDFLNEEYQSWLRGLLE